MVFQCVLVFLETGGPSRAGACPFLSLGVQRERGHASVHLGPRGGWRLEPGRSLVLALSASRPRSAPARPGRRLALVRGPSGRTPAGGGGLGSGGHLQPPDCDLSQAAPCCSPDLTQALPSAAGRPSPGSAPRRSTMFLRLHPDRGRPLHPTWAPRSSEGT